MCVLLSEPSSLVCSHAAPLEVRASVCITGLMICRRVELRHPGKLSAQLSDVTFHLSSPPLATTAVTVLLRGMDGCQVTLLSDGEQEAQWSQLHQLKVWIEDRCFSHCSRGRNSL